MKTGSNTTGPVERYEVDLNPLQYFGMSCDIVRVNRNNLQRVLLHNEWHMLSGEKGNYRLVKYPKKVTKIARFFTKMWQKTTKITWFFGKSDRETE